jgi:hypothetical protein
MQLIINPTQCLHQNRLVHPIRRAAHPQMLTDAFIDFGSVPLDSTKDSRVIHV